MNSMKKNRFMHVLVLFLGSASICFAQGIDQTRLEKDLDIMEGILDKLLKGQASEFEISGSSRGFYLDNYGIVFYTSQSGPVLGRDYYAESLRYYKDHLENAIRISGELAEAKEDLESARGELKKAAAEAGKKAVEAEKTKEGLTEAYVAGTPAHIEEMNRISKEEAQKAIEGLKEKLSLFFKNYASGIGQLKADDRIAVLVNIKNWNLSDFKEHSLSGSILKNDLESYRKHAINEAEFMKRISFQMNGADSDISSDIGIMSEIFDRGLENSDVMGRASNYGIYVKGLGALFFIDSPYSLYFQVHNGKDFYISSFAVDKAIQYSVEGKNITAADQEAQEKAKADMIQKQKKSLQKLENDLVDLISSYGHTLRLEPSEKIIVNLNLGKQIVIFGQKEKEPSAMIIQVSKKVIDDYNSGVLSQPDLRNRMIVKTF